MFSKVLIANRGEIAVRIIRACRELGLETVAVCSEADKGAMHAQIADQTICIGPNNSKDSYLNIPAIISACQITGAEAVHPGFGFLSESATFATALEKCGITFIGPTADIITLMGDKAAAKKAMKKAGVPVVPGSDGVIENIEKARELAETMGYPLLIKASAGGGGRGIRLVENEFQLENAFDTAREEALRFFADNSVYMEKFLINPRHVEVQLLADKKGNVVHLGERDCSLQRRNQKVIEETPCPAKIMTPDLRKKICNTAAKAAKAIGYTNAGTIEFLMDSSGDFYFIEMNTRVQVEHPITEAVTGVDIVKNQLLIAMGKPLSFRQKDIKFSGHAIECRINAENPRENFRPSPGTISTMFTPGGPGIRVDSAVFAGYTIPPYYDNMIAKLISYAPTREEAIAKMNWALVEFIVDGVDTNIDFQLENIRDEAFVKGNYDIGYLNRRLTEQAKE